jgi:hypothetical protein
LPDFQFTFFHFLRQECGVRCLPLDFPQQLFGKFLAFSLQLRFHLLQHDEITGFECLGPVGSDAA